MAKGRIEKLPSGKFRARVYLGVDPVTGKEQRELGRARVEYREAVSDLGELLERLEYEREADQKATLAFTLAKYLPLADVDEKTRKDYRRQVRDSLLPTLGDRQIRRIKAGDLEDLYARLRTCSRLCDQKLAGKKVTVIRRWKDREKKVEEVHQCVPYSVSTIRTLNWIISGAFDLAIRRDWAKRNPAREAKLPKLHRPEPEAPSPAAVGELLAAAWEHNPDLAVYLWLAVVTGSRRGEVCGLRFNRFELDVPEVPAIAISKSYKVFEGQRIEKDTKTHQARRMAIDTITAEVVREHQERCQARLAPVGIALPGDAFLFSNDGGTTAWNPDWVTHQVALVAQVAGVDATIRSLRHYNATELVSNGIDLRTAAGRLGHGSGGATTMRVYAHRTPLADQRAAEVAVRALSRPAAIPAVRFEKPLEEILDRPAGPLPQNGRAPYLTVAQDFRDAIRGGRLVPGDLVPALPKIGAFYEVSAGTVQRALVQLGEEGLLVLRRGARTRVADPAHSDDS